MDYAGVVWCITVPHGAFIARRNGLIFATGNSGFPKSLDVSKAIDKHIAREEAPISQNVIDAGLVGAWLRDQCAARGIGSRQINEHFNAANVAMRWMLAAPTETKRPQVPKWQQWEELRRWLDLPDDMDAEVWRLNGNKGTPAPLAFTREVKVYDQSHGFARVGLAHGAQKSHTATSQVVEMGYATGPGDTPATPDAERWQGWGTALKPAFEPVVVARKPLAGTVAANVLEHGTGALNIDGCRIEASQSDVEQRESRNGTTRHAAHESGYSGGWNGLDRRPGVALGRWPANVALDESQAAALDEQSGTLTSGLMRAGTKPKGERETYGQDAAAGYETTRDTPGDSGGASRFFYVAKADASERPRLPKRSLRLRDDLTPEQVDHVRARLVEAGVQVD